MGVSEYVETMLVRIRMILSDSRMKSITSGTEDIKLHEWLTKHIATAKPRTALSPSSTSRWFRLKVVHVITAVIAPA